MYMPLGFGHLFNVLYLKGELSHQKKELPHYIYIVLNNYVIAPYQVISGISVMNVRNHKHQNV